MNSGGARRMTPSRPLLTIVLVGERHVFHLVVIMALKPRLAAAPLALIVLDGDKPRIGDRGAVSVAGELSQYALGTAEGRLGVDDEGAMAQGAHALGEGGGVGERGEFAEEAELAAAEGGRQAVQE